MSALAAGPGNPIARPPAPEEELPNLSDPALFNAPLQVRGRDASVNERFLPSRRAGVRTVRRTAFGIDSSFDSYTAIDVGGASNGTYVVTTNEYGDVHIYTANGSLVQYIPYSSLFCGSDPLPVCSTPGGYNGDGRVLYDPARSRWIVSSLWINSRPVQTVLAVSQTSNPRGGWYLYEFPTCGSYDNWDGSDQPHTGFNTQWIVSTAACEANPNNPNQIGAGLAVIDKRALYTGQALSLNANWFEFQDPVELTGNRDNPVLTYGPTRNHREYLTASAISSGYAAEIYSDVEGPVDAPAFYSKTLQVTTGFAATGPVPVSAPGCTACIAAYSNGWTHSSSVFTFNDGNAYILSTSVVGDPSYSNANQIVSEAVNTATAATTSLQLEGGISGAGPLASAITMLLVPNYSYNAVEIGYDQSASDFYPGVELALWNVDANAIGYRAVLQEGTLTPTGGDAPRWTDFMDTMTPIPNSSEILVGGTIAAPSKGRRGNTDPDRSTYYSLVTP